MDHNIIELETKTHVRLHEILNIPMSSYSKRTRHIKKETNHTPIRTPAVIENIGYIQKEFFKNISRLPASVHSVHVQRMREYADYHIADLIAMWGDEIDNENKAFSVSHDNLVLAKKEKARIMIEHMKKIY